MARIRYPVLASRTLAACLLLAWAVAFVTAELPASPETRVGIITSPGVLALIVWTRVVGPRREPTDIVLSLFSVPCAVVSVWAGYEALSANHGVVWGGLLSIVGGALLAVAVLADAATERLVGSRST